MIKSPCLGEAFGHNAADAGSSARDDSYLPMKGESTHPSTLFRSHMVTKSADTIEIYPNVTAQTDGTEAFADPMHS